MAKQSTTRSLSLTVDLNFIYLKGFFFFSFFLCFLHAPMPIPSSLLLIFIPPPLLLLCLLFFSNFTLDERVSLSLSYSLTDSLAHVRLLAQCRERERLGSTWPILKARHQIRFRCHTPVVLAQLGTNSDGTRGLLVPLFSFDFA